MSSALFPGSFDPITRGHLDIIHRAAPHFERLVIAVFVNPAKQGMFSLTQRLDFITHAVAHLDNVEVSVGQGLVVECAQQLGLDVILKGLRSGVDFDYEFPMAHMNNHLCRIDTLFILAAPQYSFLSSSLVKEVALLGGDISEFVTPEIAQHLYEKYHSQKLSS